jgi:hypothetical protein
MMMKTEMVLETSVSFIHLTRLIAEKMMMKTEMVLETSVSFIHLTRLIARENDDIDRDGPRNVGFIHSSDATDCPRRFY